MLVEKGLTAPVPSVGADGGQPIANRYMDSISESHSEYNSLPQSPEEMLRMLNQLNDPNYLPTISLRDLYENTYHGRPPIIEGLLHMGTYLFVGAPKVGKSFLMAQLAYHVSTGQPLWGFPVRQGTVLYLALEDDHRRLQSRLFRMFGAEGTDNLYFATAAKQLSQGLEGQLEKFIQDHPNTKLVIIDTLQKIREAAGETYSYASDYEVIGRLKTLADQRGICLLLVHHTRKQQANDKFDMISGTNGLLGAADGAFLLQKENRTDHTATLGISGRDQQDQRLYLKRDLEHLVWNLERTETELWKEPPDPIVEAAAGLLTAQHPTWSGTATELVSALQVDLTPNALGMRLSLQVDRLLEEFHIQYTSTRSHAGRRITLTLLPA